MLVTLLELIGRGHILFFSTCVLLTLVNLEHKIHPGLAGKTIS